MGYFDGITAASFKRDARGRDLFFFWGRIGRGRVIPSEADGAYVKTYLKTYLIGVFVVIVPIVVLANSMIFEPRWFALVGALMLGALLSLTPLHLRIRNWELSDERMTYKETLTASAKAHGSGTLLFFVVVMGLATAVGMFVTLFSPETLIGGLLTVFCAVAFVILLFMLRTSRRG
jgi:hypothetical protein